MNKIKEVKSYFMAFGCTEVQAEKKVEELLSNNEFDEFYNNMYV